MRIRGKSIVASVATIGLVGALAAVPARSADTSAPVTVMCVGATGDVAGDLSGAPKSSRDLLGLAASVAGMPTLPPFPTTVTSDAPDKVPVGSGDRTVNFNYSIGVPQQVAALMRDQLKVPSLVAHDTTIGVTASGPTTGSANAVAPPTTLDLSNPAAAVTGSVKLTVDTSRSGRIFFRPAPITMKLDVNASVAGVANIGTITLECTAQGVIASTAVLVKGTPSTPAVIDGPTVAGGESSIIPLLGRPDIVPDDNNPILPESLRVTNPANGASIKDGALVQPTAAAGGTYASEVEICAAPRMTPDTPGIDEIQSLTFPTSYPVKPGLELFNPHPLGMKLSFKGDKTAEIPLTTNYGTGLEFAGQFAAPSAKKVQEALEALPSIGAGNITVSRAAEGGGYSYKFTFTGDLAEADQPQIELSDWRTQLDYASYDQIMAAVNGLTGGGGGGGTDAGGGAGGGAPDPGATDMNLDQLGAALQAGSITLDQYFAKFASALKNSLMAEIKPHIPEILDTLSRMFPQKPELATVTGGEAMVPGGSTGPLCTTFFVQTVATPAQIVKKVGSRVGPPCRVSGRTVKVRVKVRTRVRGKMRTVRRTVKVVRTVRRGGCPQAITWQPGKLVVSNLPVRATRVTAHPRKVTITVTAKGIKGKVTKTLAISKKTAAASGSLKLPASFEKAERLTVRISGKSVAAQTRSLLQS